ILLPQRITVNAKQIAVLTQQAEQFNQLGFDLLLSDKILIIRAVPSWLRHSAISQWLPLWLEQLCPDSPEPLVKHLLSMLLNANRVSARAMLHSIPQLLNAPEFWLSVPLQLETTLSLLTEL